MFFHPPFLDLLFLIKFFFEWSILGPLQNPVGANTGSQIDQVAPKWPNTSLPCLPFCTSEKANTSRNAEWIKFIFSHFFRFLHFRILAAQLSTNACVFHFCWLRHIHRETPIGSALRNPMVAKREAPPNQEGRSARRLPMYLASPTLAV